MDIKDFSKAIEDLKREKLEEVFKELIGTNSMEVIESLIEMGDIEISKEKQGEKDIYHFVDYVTEEVREIIIYFDEKKLQVIVNII